MADLLICFSSIYKMESFITHSVGMIHFLVTLNHRMMLSLHLACDLQ